MMLPTEAAITYLMAKNPKALESLDKPTPIIGRQICIWLPKEVSVLAFDLPKLARGIRL
jgi:hypothetical protein